MTLTKPREIPRDMPAGMNILGYPVLEPSTLYRPVNGQMDIYKHIDIDAQQLLDEANNRRNAARGGGNYPFAFRLTDHDDLPTLDAYLSIALARAEAGDREIGGRNVEEILETYAGLAKNNTKTVRYLLSQGDGRHLYNIPGEHAQRLISERPSQTGYRGNISVSAPGQLRSDGLFTSMQLTNNAAKRGKADNVMVDFERDDSGAYIVKVSDDGTGIDPNFLPHLSYGYTNGGTGVGLAAVRKLVEYADGTLSVVTRFGDDPSAPVVGCDILTGRTEMMPYEMPRGTTFTARFPRSCIYG